MEVIRDINLGEAMDITFSPLFFFFFFFFLICTMMMEWRENEGGVEKERGNRKHVFSEHVKREVSTTWSATVWGRNLDEDSRVGRNRE